jgi:hypothetical protein
LALIILTMPETFTYGYFTPDYPPPYLLSNFLRTRPVLLVRRAREIRRETKDERYYADMERSKFSISARVEKVLARPFIIMVQEPMLIASTVYMSVRISSLLPSILSSLRAYSLYTDVSTFSSKRSPSYSPRDITSTPARQV